jgi:hypothetical protein
MAEQSSLEARAGAAAGNSSDRMESPRLVLEPARAEASMAEPVRLDGGVADAFKVDPPRTAGKIFVASTTNRVRENRAASPKVDPVRTDASKVDMSKVEIARVGKIATAAPAERSWDSKSSSAKAATDPGKAAQQLKQDTAKADQAKAGASKMAGRAKLSVSRIAGQLLLAALPMVRSLISWRPKSASPKAAQNAPYQSAANQNAANAKAASPKAEVRAEAGWISPEKRRLSSLAAVAAIAAAAGAIGGVLATSLFPQVSTEAAMTTSDNATLEASVARIDSDLQALKTGTEQGGQAMQGQGADNQTSERLDRLERAEADSSAKILRLNEATERLRVAVQSTPGMPPIPPVPPVPARERETTGSATQTSTSTAASAFGAVRPTATPKPVDAGKLPVVQGWSLRDVNHGLALIEGRNGFYEVYAGDPIPGLGRVDSIKRQDGRWVVVTTKGLVVSR